MIESKRGTFGLHLPEERPFEFRQTYGWSVLSILLYSLTTQQISLRPLFVWPAVANDQNSRIETKQPIG